MEASVQSHTDVLVVGCGPVGAAFALMLGRLGISTLVIDKAPDIYLAPRAIAFDFDALRILQSVGVGEADFEQVRIPVVRLISPLFGEFARINTGQDVDTHPMQITFYQPDLERGLRRKLEQTKNLALSLGTELVALTQTREGVLASVRHADGQMLDIRAGYLVGADGAHSVVRGIIGRDFQGSSFAEDWLIVDAQNPSQPIDHVEFLCNPKRPTPHMVAPGGRQRWEFMLARGESRQQMERDEEIDRLLAPWGGIAAMKIERKAVYRFHARIASSFRNGRVFLIGDAAHITPPFVGQGLVSGLRDAANLSWKLAYVIQGKAGRHILDSYDQERRPHAKAMINLARFMAKLIMPRHHLSAFIVHGTMKLMRCVPGLRALLDEQGIRPSNSFRRGCFIKSASWPKPGHMFPQVWLLDPKGNEFRSDDVLGQHFALIGLNTDPGEYLTEDTRQFVSSLGATAVAIGHADTSTAARFHYRLKTPSALLPKGDRRVALVRPDRIVIATCRARDTASMLRSVKKYLDG
ncbi:3-(3-hydroxy-phenyl)propionate hydroxylase [Fulvimarina manganoxydans]|uniref:3-(3-hydroxy-phenyl)propionate hydroxylase n=1 Tax=Fulvimarina manganoxydans TaxID=937218 RepID=A0A1W2E9A5_9HYPH|nr:bifunctional 3-(3-hydroxy-phenyl)propionate/3-hydroxycinnamic acid hydroxylase [Fulvimarina manganoxydans]SMD06360.1 3-(3-hydroxy-phenyl)propionate hydroxylase [Fulvimarina manganoxydans]